MPLALRQAVAGSLPMLPNTSDAFDALMIGNEDLTSSIHATYMLRRFHSLGIKARTVERNGEFSHILVPAADDCIIEIRPNRGRGDGFSIYQPMMTWHEYLEPARSLRLKAKKPTGYYSYSASFTFLIDDYDPDNPDKDSVADEDGPAQIGDFSFGSGDFQQFFFGAIFQVKEISNFEVFPEFRQSRVAL